MNGNTNANVLYPRRYKICFHYATLVPYLLRFFPQVPYMPHIMNLKKLRFVHFNKVTETGVKAADPSGQGLKNIVFFLQTL
jgi:hypothetical protein